VYFLFIFLIFFVDRQPDPHLVSRVVRPIQKGCGLSIAYDAIGVTIGYQLGGRNKEARGAPAFLAGEKKAAKPTIFAWTAGRGASPGKSKRLSEIETGIGYQQPTAADQFGFF